MDGRRRMPDHGYTLSSGELMIQMEIKTNCSESILFACVQKFILITVIIKRKDKYLIYPHHYNAYDYSKAR